MPSEILALGAILVDHIHFTKEEELFRFAHAKGGMEFLSEAELTEIVQSPHFKSQAVPGGSAVNTLKGLQHLGHKGAIIGKRGADSAGQYVETLLQGLGIKTLIGLGHKPTGQVICFVTPDGQRTMRTYLGANEELSPRDLNEDALTGAHLLHIEGYTLAYPHVTLSAMQLARRKGVKVSFDLASFQMVETFKQEILELLPYIDTLFANENEAFALTGLKPKEACAWLQERVPIAVVMVGVDGAYIGDREQIIQVPAIPVHPTDTTGAGDLFASGFLHGYLSGYPLATAGHLGSMAAHEVVQVLGAELTQATWQKILTKAPLSRA